MESVATERTGIESRRLEIHEASVMEGVMALHVPHGNRYRQGDAGIFLDRQGIPGRGMVGAGRFRAGSVIRQRFETDGAFVVQRHEG